MALRDHIVGFFRADVRLSEIEPYRRAGGDAYELFESTPPESWARLAAWNAFLLQVYGDNVISKSSSRRYVSADAVVFARRLFQWANVWIEEALKTQAGGTYRFGFDMPYLLPHWVDSVRSDAQLAAMRATLDTGRMRTTSGVEAFSGDDARRGRLRVFQAEVDAETVYVDRLWTGKPTHELRATISFALEEALDHVYQLGQLLAQPELFERL